MGRSSPREATPSPPLPRGRLSGTSRRSSAMSPLTSSRRWRPLPPLPPWRRPMSFPTGRSLPLATRGSGALRLSSSPSSWVLSLSASTRPPTTPSSTGNASRVQSTIKCHPLGFRERKKTVLNDKKNLAPQNKHLPMFGKKKKKKKKKNFTPKKKTPPIFGKKKKKKKKKSTLR